MNQTVLLTGASSGIGQAIASRLSKDGYQVLGIGRTFTDTSGFHPVILDLMDTPRVIETITQLRKTNDISILINCAGVGYYGPHETLNPQKIHELVTVNLELPMLLTNLLLRDLKQSHGSIINISSVTAKKTNTYGCAYGATKAGLSSFSASLFEEVRKHGVKVTTICPDMTKTNLYRNADFTEGDAEDTYLYPDEVADAVLYVLHCRDGMLPTEITLSPQKHQIKRKS